jgi:hypothetical protein
MKNFLVLVLGWIIGLIGGYFAWNDMRYQRDVALTTADWCVKSPQGWRCQAFLSGEEKIPFNLFYHDK